MKKAFTMIELIFAIVIIGILAAIALPKFNETKTFTDEQKVKQELEKVKIGIQNKINNQIISGNYQCPELETSLTDNQVFDKVLVNPIPTDDNGIKWDDETNTSNYTKYKITIDNTPSFEIKYNKNFKNGCNFSCVDTNNKTCQNIIK